MPDLTAAQGAMTIDLHDRLLIMLFTRGLCHSLAFAIHGLIGGRVVVATEQSGPYVNPTHVGVQINGKIIDIEGIHSIGEFVHRWGEVVVTDRQDFEDKWEDNFELPLDVSIAAGVAEAIVTYTAAEKGVSR